MSYKVRFYVFSVIVFSCFLFSCSSVMNKKIIIPKDIKAKGEVKEIEKQTKEDELKITQITHDKDTLPLNNDDSEKLDPIASNVAIGIGIPDKLSVPIKDTEKKENKKSIKDGKIDKNNVKYEKTEKVIKNPFVVGETIIMDISYLGIKAAKLSIETLPYVTVNGRKAFHFIGKIKTTALMNVIYKARDEIEVFVDTRYIVPLKYVLRLNESKQNVRQIVNYDHEKGEASYWKKRIDEHGNVSEINRIDKLVPYALDMFSTMTFVRIQDFKVGDSIDMIVHDNGKNWDMTVHVLREERIWTRLGKVDTYVMKPEVRLNGELKNKGDITVWVTKDERKILVKLKAKVKIGSLNATIKDYITGTTKM